MYVREADHVMALRLLEAAAASRTRRELVGHVMPALRQLVHADEVSYSEILTRVGGVGFTTAHPTPTAAQPEALHTFRSRPAEHPWVAHVLRGRDGSSVRLSELRSTAQLRRSAFYQDFYRPRGIQYADYQGIPIAEGRIAGFGVCRSRRDFTADEHDLFEHVRRPLARIWDLVGRLEVVDDRSSRTTAATRDLTPAERRVAQLVLQGWRTKQIAANLGVSAKAVEQHLTRIYRKAEVGSRAAYVAHALGEATLSE